MGSRRLRLVYPHQLFASHLEADPGTRFVLVEDDLLYRQLPFHAHKLVLHRAGLLALRGRLQEAGFDVDLVESSADEPTGRRLSGLIAELAPDRVEVYDVVDDWLSRDCRSALRDGGYRLRPDDVLESPSFLTDRRSFTDWFGANRARMASFYTWQRRRLGVLVDDSGDPVGGRWSFDTENRRKLPRGHPVPPRSAPAWTSEVEDAVAWVAEHFPEAPGDPATFCWPVTPEDARAGMAEFFADRFAEFGPYEDAISAEHPFVFHSTLSPALNAGLLTPHEVLDAALRAAAQSEVPLPSLEGFVRQIIGWREYVRATYHLYGRRMRCANRLGHTRPLAPGWWDGTTGLAPVDLVVGRVLERGYAHHIERLMVLGNAMALLRTDPTEVYEWFSALFVDAYDWVMVPNVYAMSQYADTSITTKPYVSGSAYLRRMSDLPRGDWEGDWDALYWTFVEDQREVFEGNPRSRVITRNWDAMEAAKRAELLDRGRRVIGRL